jgi:hypothetical protein
MNGRLPADRQPGCLLLLLESKQQQQRRSPSRDVQEHWALCSFWPIARNRSLRIAPKGAKSVEHS